MPAFRPNLDTAPFWDRKIMPTLTLNKNCDSNIWGASCVTVGRTILFIKLEEMLPLWGKSGPYLIEEPDASKKSQQVLGSWASQSSRGKQWSSM